MTRVVDKVFRGSWSSTGAVAAQILYSDAQSNALINFDDEFSVAVFTQNRLQPEAYYATFPSFGPRKINAGTAGFNMQMNGNGAAAKGAPYFRVDADTVEYVYTPTTSPGVQDGNRIGWRLDVATVNRGTVKYYINGRPSGTRTYPHGTGVAIPGVNLEFTVGGAAGFSSRLFPNCAVQTAAFNRELTAEEIFHWWFADKIPRQGCVILHDASNWLSGNPVNLVNPAFSSTSTAALSKGAEVPS